MSEGGCVKAPIYIYRHADIGTCKSYMKLIVPVIKSD